MESTHLSANKALTQREIVTVRSTVLKPWTKATAEVLEQMVDCISFESRLGYSTDSLGNILGPSGPPKAR